MKKLGSFLLAILVIWAVLLMMATDGRAERESQLSETKPAKPQSSTLQELLAQSTKPPAPTTEQTLPRETEPQLPDTAESTAPRETEEQPAAENPDDSQPAEPSEAAMKRVRKILEGEELAKTARSHWVWNPDLNFHGDTTGTALSSNGLALALYAAERKMNPVSAFWTLTREGLYKKTEDTSGVLSAAAFAVPGQEAKEYAHTDAGSRQLVTDLLNLASGLEDGLFLESGLLGANGAVDQGQMDLARKEGCWYGYFISGGERSTHILCFYLRSDKEGKPITDVEFQLLNLRSAEGGDDALAALDRRGDTQAATLIAAAELLLTGQTQAGQGMIPFTRQVGEFTATIERFDFTAEGETGTLTNYRLRKG